MERNYDALVVGAGISGLAGARRLARVGLKVGVLEADSRCGGAIHSARFAVGTGEYWLELGAHTLFSSYRALLTGFPELHLEEVIRTRRRLPFLLWGDGQPRSIVAALRWGELARHLPRAAWQKRAGQRVGDWFSAVAGPANYAQVIGPSLDALLCQPAAEFPADLLFKKRARADDFPRSFSLQGGLGALTERMTQGFTVHTDARVSRIMHEAGGFRCETASDLFFAPRLLLALPADETARLARDVAPSLARQVARIPMQHLDSLGVVVAAGDVTLPPLAGMVARDAPWYSMVSRDVITAPALRGFTFHFRPGLNADERLHQVERVLRVDAQRFITTVATHHRLPALRLGHESLVTGIDRELSHQPIGVTGNYFGGLGIEECVARALGETERLLRKKLP